MKPSNAKVKWKTEVDTNIQNGVIYKKRTNKLKFKSQKHQIIKINQNYIIDSCTVCSINGNFSHVIADIIILIIKLIIIAGSAMGISMQ